MTKPLGCHLVQSYISELWKGDVLCCTKKKTPHTIQSPKTVSESRTALNSSSASRNAMMTAAVKITLPTWKCSSEVYFPEKISFVAFFPFYFHMYLPSPWLSLCTAPMQMIFFFCTNWQVSLAHCLPTIWDVYLFVAGVYDEVKRIYGSGRCWFETSSALPPLCQNVGRRFLSSSKAFFKNNLPAVDFVPEEGKCENKDASLG